MFPTNREQLYKNALKELEDEQITEISPELNGEHRIGTLWRLFKEAGVPERDIKGSSVTLSMKPLETSKPSEKDKKE